MANNGWSEERQTGAYVTKIHTQEKATKENLLSIRSMAGEAYAANVLSDKALRIYLMITANKNGYQCLVSSIGIGGTPLPKGMSRSSFTRALKELIENGFMVKRENSEVWDFYDKPQDVEEYTIVLHKENENFEY